MEAIRIDATMEQELKQSGVAMVSVAQGLIITNNEEFEKGNNILREIKSRAKKVKEYWKGPKEAANAAHKELVAKEAQMLKPLQEAETIIKKAMLAYDAEIKRQQREAEEAARKQREEEVKRMEALAEKAQEQGDEDTAEIMRDMAEAVPIKQINVSAPTTNGVSVRMIRKARVTDEKLVPAYFDGYELRTINMSILNSLAKMTSGDSKIPGVEFYEESIMTVRT